MDYRHQGPPPLVPLLRVAEQGFVNLHTLVFRHFLVPLCGENTTLASFCFAALFVLFNWCFGYILYKKKIYIKI